MKSGNHADTPIGRDGRILKTETTMTYKRPKVTREVRRSLAAATAAEAIGELAHGCEVYGLSKGQFSLIDIVRHCLVITGPADVTISTWTAAGADLGFAYKLLTDGAIRSVRFIVDFSFPTRQPAYCAALRERFGDDCIRVTKTHAKFVMIRNTEWDIAIRSSMNLNENRRLESFEISDDAGMCDYLETVIAEIFAMQTGTECLEKKPYGHVKDFERLAGVGTEDEAVMLGSTDAKKFFGDGMLDIDVRRAGASYADH